MSEKRSSGIRRSSSTRESFVSWRRSKGGGAKRRRGQEIASAIPCETKAKRADRFESCAAKECKGAKDVRKFQLQPQKRIRELDCGREARRNAEAAIANCDPMAGPGQTAELEISLVERREHFSWGRTCPLLHIFDRELG